MVMINSNFWNNKKVLITRHTGFKGMWLYLILKSIDASIYGLSYGNHSDIYKRLGGEKYFDEEYFYDLSIFYYNPELAEPLFELYNK